MIPTDPAANPPRFLTTRWSLVAAARVPDEQGRRALAELCRLYWYPLYAWIRRRGYTRDEAEDLTQGLFARLLERDGLASFQSARGRFRAFLLGACRHYLANEWDRARAEKRGGDRTRLPLDFGDAEERYAREPDRGEVDRLFERRWALTLLEQVLVRLRGEFESAGKTEHFEALKGTLIGDESAPSYARIGERLGMSESAVKVAVHRLRKRYRELLREEIAETVSSPEEIEEEIRDLFEALGRRGK